MWKLVIFLKISNNHKHQSHAMTIENLKSETGWEFHVLLIKHTECTHNFKYLIIGWVKDTPSPTISNTSKWIQTRSGKNNFKLVYPPPSLSYCNFPYPKVSQYLCLHFCEKQKSDNWKVHNSKCLYCTYILSRPYLKKTLSQNSVAKKKF